MKVLNQSKLIALLQRFTEDPDLIEKITDALLHLEVDNDDYIDTIITLVEYVGLTNFISNLACEIMGTLPGIDAKQQFIYSCVLRYQKYYPDDDDFYNNLIDILNMTND
jgi:hypothetical protein